MFNIKKFTDFQLLTEEARMYIWAKSFRIDDLLSSNIYKTSDIFKWMREYSFDRWAIGIFVTKKKATSDSPLNRFKTTKPEHSEFGELLDSGDLDKIESYIQDDKELSNIEDVDLRLSSKGASGKYFFNSESKVGKGQLIEESVFNFNGDEIYLWIFERNSNKDNRARQLRGIVYEKQIKTSLRLKESPKGERWDATGPLDFKYINEILNSDADILLNGRKIVSSLQIPDDFFKVDNNWSIKSCSYKSSSIYFADFKRISGLIKEGNRLIRTDKDLSNFILVVGFHESGIFTKQYIVNVDINNWKRMIPDISDNKVIAELESMYKELQNHRLGSKSNPGERTDETEAAWVEYMKKWRKLTKNTPIKLNFKRDTEGQLRIQCSMSVKVFNEILLKENDWILIQN